MPATLLPALDYAAVVLAGGHSRRMGTDKALLPHPRTGEPLLLRQLGLFRHLQPAPVQCLVSARAGQSLPTWPAEVIRVDDDGSAGPLGGLLACFAATSAPALLVVAVDLPDLGPALLQQLLNAAAASGRGVLPRHEAGCEPLLAVYPRALRGRLETARAAGHHGLQRLLNQPALVAVMDSFPLAVATPDLRNWNHPVAD